MESNYASKEGQAVLHHRRDAAVDDSCMSESAHLRNIQQNEGNQ